MALIDWLIVIAFGAWLARDGLRHARASKGDAQHWLLAGRNAPWWAMGLSIMATQASAITLVGTTGKGFEDGTRFAQFYYSLPLAMLILGLFFLPFHQRMRSTTAYDWLERHHGRLARTLVAATFLIQRALALGVVLSVPAVLLAALLDLPYPLTVALVTIAAIAYTTAGGVAAVLSTDVKQMAVMLLGLGGLIVVTIQAMPAGFGPAEAWAVADALDRAELADWSLDVSERYTIWSSLFGATIIFLAYFGTDQSQVQRYLAGRDLGQQRRALTLNAIAKIPLQIVILLLGVGLFFWSLLEPTPLHLSPAKEEAAREILGDEHEALSTRHAELRSRIGDEIRGYASASTDEGRESHLRDLRAGHAELVSFREGIEERLEADDAGGMRESNWIVPWFLQNRIPAGLVGIFLAAILAAALSSIDSELAALGAVTTIDLLRVDPDDPANGERLLRTSRVATMIAGLLAALFALSLAHAQSVVEQVNAIGSYFYGSLLGVFLLAMFVRFATGLGLIAGLILGMCAVPLAVHLHAEAADGAALPFLYKNTVGLLTCLISGALVSRLGPAPRRP